MQLKRNVMDKISCCFVDMVTQEKIQKIFVFFFFFWGGGGLFVEVLKLAVNRRTKFRNTHWLDNNLRTVDDKPWKLFCKTSLNARE